MQAKEVRSRGGGTHGPLAPGGQPGWASAAPAGLAVAGHRTRCLPASAPSSPVVLRWEVRAGAGEEEVAWGGTASAWHQALSKLPSTLEPEVSRGGPCLGLLH